MVDWFGGMCSCSDLGMVCDCFDFSNLGMGMWLFGFGCGDVVVLICSDGFEVSGGWWMGLWLGVFVDCGCGFSRCGFGFCLP